MKDYEKWRDWGKNEIRLAFADDSTVRNLMLNAWENITEAMGEKYSKRAETIKIAVENLLTHHPLSPLKNQEEEWEAESELKLDSGQPARISSWYHRRYPSLCKFIYSNSDGENVTCYTDKKRYVCVDVNNPKNIWTGGIGGKVLEELHPLTFPYNPEPIPIKVYMDQHIHHDDKDQKENCGVFAVAYFLFPDGKLEKVYRYFKETPESGITEINIGEYVLEGERINKLNFGTSGEETDGER